MIKSSNIKPITIIKSLSRLLPVNVTNNPRIRQGKCDEQLAPTVCFLEETENNNFCFKWAGALPAKCKLILDVLYYYLPASNETNKNLGVKLTDLIRNTMFVP